jgi:hypothetical protein
MASRPPTRGRSMPPQAPIPQQRMPPAGSPPQRRQAPPPSQGEDFDDDIDDDFDQHPQKKTMENYDDSFNDDVDNPQFFDDPRDTFTGDPAYNQAVSRAQLAKTYYPKQIGEFIRKSTLFPDTKATMNTISHGLFDKTEVLAKTENIRIEIIDVSIILAQARIGFHPMDVDNPDLSTLMNMILHHYQRYISRSAGGWERGLQNVIETAHTNRNVMEQRPMGGGGMKQKPWYRRFI